MRVSSGFRTTRSKAIIAIGITLIFAAALFFWYTQTWWSPSIYVQQPELIRLTNLHIWVTNNNQTSVMALAVINVGVRDLTLDAITVDGTSIPYDLWYYHYTDRDSVLNDVKDRLKPDYSPATVDIDSQFAGEEAFRRALEPILFKPGEAVIVYVLNPDEIDETYQGSSVAVSVKAGTAQSVQAVEIVTSD